MLHYICAKKQVKLYLPIVTLYSSRINRYESFIIYYSNVHTVPVDILSNRAEGGKHCPMPNPNPHPHSINLSESKCKVLSSICNRLFGLNIGDILYSNIAKKAVTYIHRIVMISMYYSRLNY